MSALIHWLWSADPKDSTGQVRLARYLPWIVVLLALTYLSVLMARPGTSEDEANLDQFGRLPVLAGGRVKPIDTLARTSMMMISSKEECTTPNGKSGQPAVRWLLDLLTFDEPPDALKDKLTFRIENAHLLELLKLPPRLSQIYTYPEIHASQEVLDKEDKRLRKLKPADLTDDDQAFRELTQQIGLAELLISTRARDYKVIRIENDQLLKAMELDMRPGSYRYSLVEIAPYLPLLRGLAAKAKGVEEHQRELIDAKALELWRKIELITGLMTQGEHGPFFIPVARGEGQWEWVTRTDALQFAHMGGQAPQALRWFTGILNAWKDGKPREFNRQVEAYRTWLDEKLPKQAELNDIESFVNHFSPFYHCAVLYVLVGVLSCLAWLVWERPLHRAAFWLMVFTLVVHTWALFVRMYLMGRPLVFVTNLYSSAIFIGWGCVVLAVILEVLYKNGIGNLLGSLAGYITLVIASNLAMEGDTLEMMRAVLDTNFWLATHVTTVTLGYTATFAAGGLGIFFILRGLLTPSLTGEKLKQHTQMMYGIICFATLLSFVGTVLGGIWADQSWGRFWGWDPKENGALLIVIWNAMILHARWGGMIKQRGMAVLAVLGNIVTAWSWFGTNMLGIGLHSYGFMAGAFNWLMTFAFLMLTIAGLGMLPLKYWRSFAKPAGAEVPPVQANQSRGVPAGASS